MIARLLQSASSMSSTACNIISLQSQRKLHSRNKKASEFIGKGWNAIKEVDRVKEHCEINDVRLMPYLRTAKENFELALEVDNSNSHARYWLSKLHLEYHTPGACRAIGTQLLMEAADMGDPDAQYDLGRKLRAETEYFDGTHQAFYYIEKAVDQLHPEALYLLGAVYLAGDCVDKNLSSALWCFHRASQKGHVAAAIACGSLILRGVNLPEPTAKFPSRKSGIIKPEGNEFELFSSNRIAKAKEKFGIAAKKGSALGLIWLQRIENAEQNLHSDDVQTD